MKRACLSLYYETIRVSNMTYEYQLKELPKQLTLTIRTRSSFQNLPHKIGDAYGSIMVHLREVGEQPTGMPFIIFYNLDMQDLDVEIGFPVSKTLKDKDNIKSSKIDAGQFATTIHLGPYEDIVPTYEGLMKWIKDNGYETAGPAIEYYLNDPNEVGMENAKTEIHFPLK